MGIVDGDRAETAGRNGRLMATLTGGAAWSARGEELTGGARAQREGERAGVGWGLPAGPARGNWVGPVGSVFLFFCSLFFFFYLFSVLSFLI